MYLTNPGKTPLSLLVCYFARLSSCVHQCIKFFVHKGFIHLLFCLFDCSFVPSLIKFIFKKLLLNSSCSYLSSDVNKFGAS